MVARHRFGYDLVSGYDYDSRERAVGEANRMRVKLSRQYPDVKSEKKEKTVDDE